MCACAGYVFKPYSTDELLKASSRPSRNSEPPSRVPPVDVCAHTGRRLSSAFLAADLASDAAIERGIAGGRRGLQSELPLGSRDPSDCLLSVGPTIVALLHSCKGCLSRCPRSSGRRRTPVRAPLRLLFPLQGFTQSSLCRWRHSGLISNWVSFAQIERDDRLSIEGAFRVDVRPIVVQIPIALLRVSAFGNFSRTPCAVQRLPRTRRWRRFWTSRTSWPR